MLQGFYFYIYNTIKCILYSLCLHLWFHPVSAVLFLLYISICHSLDTSGFDVILFSKLNFWYCETHSSVYCQVSEQRKYGSKVFTFLGLSVYSIVISVFFLII